MSTVLALVGAWYATLTVHALVIGAVALLALRLVEPGASARAWLLRAALVLPIVSATLATRASSARDVTVSVPAPAGPRTVVVEAVAREAWPSSARTLTALLVVLAAAGPVFWGLRRARWRRRLARRERVTAVSLGLDEALLELGAGRSATLSISEAATSAIALGRHEIVLAPTIVREWPRDELRAVVAHECAHLRRGDAAWLTVGSALQALLWFVPTVALLTRRLHAACEFAADESALARTGDPTAYVHALARVRASANPPWLAALGGQPSLLVARAERALAGASPPARPLLAGLVGLALVAAAWQLPGLDAPGRRMQVTATVRGSETR